MTLIIYINAFSRRFYPKQFTGHSGYTFFVSMSFLSIMALNVSFVFVIVSNISSNVHKIAYAEGFKIIKPSGCHTLNASPQ